MESGHLDSALALSLALVSFRRQKCLNVGDFDPGEDVVNGDVAKARLAESLSFGQSRLDSQALLKFHWSCRAGCAQNITGQRNAPCRFLCPMTLPIEPRNGSKAD